MGEGKHGTEIQIVGEHGVSVARPHSMMVPSVARGSPTIDQWTACHP